MNLIITKSKSYFLVNTRMNYEFSKKEDSNWGFKSHLLHTNLRVTNDYYKFDTNGIHLILRNSIYIDYILIYFESIFIYL